MKFFPRVLISLALLAQSLSIAVPGFAANSVESYDSAQTLRSRSGDEVQAIKDELVSARNWNEGIRKVGVTEADGCINRLENAIRRLQKLPRERRMLLGCIHRLAMSSQDDRCFAVVLLENAMKDASDVQISKKNLAALSYDLALLHCKVGDLDSASSEVRKALSYFNELQGTSGLASSENDSLNLAQADCHALLAFISSRNLQHAEAGSYSALAAEKYWSAGVRNLSLRCFLNAAILAVRVKDGKKSLDDVLNRACALIKNSRETELADSVFFATRLLYERARRSLESENYSQAEEDCTKAIQLFGVEPDVSDQLAAGAYSSNKIAEKLFETPLFDDRACIDLALSYVPVPACTMPHIPASAVLALPDSVDFDESIPTWKNYDDCNCASREPKNERVAEHELRETKWNEIVSDKKIALQNQPIDDWLFAREEGFKLEIEPGLHTYSPKKIWDLYASILSKTNRVERAESLTKQSQKLFVADTVEGDEVFVFHTILLDHTVPSVAGLRAAALLRNEGLAEQIYSELKGRDSEQVYALCEKIGGNFVQNDASIALKWLYRALPPAGFSASWVDDGSGKTLHERVRGKIDKCLSSMGVNPSSSSERLKLSKEAEQKGDERTALEQLLRARELFVTREKGDPCDFKINYEIGKKYLSFQEFEHALNYLYLVRPQNVDICREIISCYLKKGDYEGAVAASLDGYSRFPDSPELFSQVLERMPTSAREMLQEAQLRVFLDDIPTAVSMCQQATKIDPSLSSDANRILADLLEKQRSIRSYKLLLQSRALLKRGLVNEAISVGEAAESANPTDELLKQDLEQIKKIDSSKPANSINLQAEERLSDFWKQNRPGSFDLARSAFGLNPSAQWAFELAMVGGSNKDQFEWAKKARQLDAKNKTYQEYFDFRKDAYARALVDAAKTALVDGSPDEAVQLAKMAFELDNKPMSAVIVDYVRILNECGQKSEALRVARKAIGESFSLGENAEIATKNKASLSGFVNGKDETLESHYAVLEVKIWAAAHKPAETGIPRFEFIEGFDLKKFFFSVGKGSVPAQVAAGDLDYGPYMKELTTSLKTLWRKRSALASDQPAKVQFAVDRSGRLLNSHLSQSSGFEFNDQIALASVRESSFKPLPAGAPAEVYIEFSFDSTNTPSVSQAINTAEQVDVPCISTSLIDPSIYPISLSAEPETTVVLPPLPQLDLPNELAAKSQPEGEEVLFFDEDLRAHPRSEESSKESKLANDFAVLLGSNGFWKDSIPLHNRALSLSPTNENWRRNLSAAHMEYGGLFLSKRNYDKALHEFGLSVAVDPSNLKSLVEAERALALMEQHQVDKSQRASAAFSAQLSFDFPEEFLQRLTIDKMYLSATESFCLVKFYLQLGLLKSAIPQISKTLDLLSRSGSDDDAKIARDCLNMMGDICRYYAEPGSSSEKDRLKLASRYYRQSLFFGLRNKAASDGLVLVSKRAVELNPKSETNKKFLAFAYALQDAIKSGRDLPACKKPTGASGF